MVSEQLQNGSTLQIKTQLRSKGWPAHAWSVEGCQVQIHSLHCVKDRIVCSLAALRARLLARYAKPFTHG